jgi:hypothetical protein
MNGKNYCFIFLKMKSTITDRTAAHTSKPGRSNDDDLEAAVDSRFFTFWFAMASSVS